MKDKILDFFDYMYVNYSWWRKLFRIKSKELDRWLEYCDGPKGCDSPETND